MHVTASHTAIDMRLLVPQCLLDCLMTMRVVFRHDLGYCHAFSKALHWAAAREGDERR
jgi:hypothetical protein